MENVLHLRDVPLHRAVLVTAPTVEPLETDEAKLHLRVTHAEEDLLITTLIRAARRIAEEYTRRALITQTWRLMLDAMPSPGIDDWWDGVRQGSVVQFMPPAMELPRPPLASVVHIKSYDDSDVATVFASTKYFVDTQSDPGRVALRNGQTWPVPDRVTNGLEIQFTCGYGAGAVNVPEPIRQGMLLLIAHMYEHREAVVTGTIATQLPLTVTACWAPYRVVL